MMWPLLLKSFVILLVTSVPAHAANIVLNVVDGPQEGFNDPTPVVPVTGNPGTTLGEQRRNVFVAAASFWEARLVSSCLLYTSPSPRDQRGSRMPSSA